MYRDHIFVYIYIYVYMYVHTRVYIYIYIYTHTHLIVYMGSVKLGLLALDPKPLIRRPVWDLALELGFLNIVSCFVHIKPRDFYYGSKGGYS